MASVLLNWTPPNAGTDQQIQYQQSTSTSWTTYTVVSNSISSQNVLGLLDNIIYNFRVASDCSFRGPTYSAITSIVNLVCPTMTITPTNSSLSYSFPFPLGSSITSYIIQLYNSNNTILLATQTVITQSPIPSSPIVGVFSGLSNSTLYTIRLTITAGIYIKICPLYSATTGSGTIYHYTRTGDFQKNNCPASPISIGSTVTYSQIYSSYISVGDAQAIALADSTFPTSGQAYANANGACNPPLPPTVTGILVVDFFSDTGLNLIGYCSSSGTTPFDQPVYTGTNFFPNDGTIPAQCWALASDNVPGPPVARFEFNITRLLQTYPVATSFVFKIQGRSVSGASLSGAYTLKGADAGNMTMTGSPGTYIPSTTGASTIGVTSFSGITIGTGADGTYGLGVGAVIMTFTYNVAAKTITQT